MRLPLDRGISGRPKILVDKVGQVDLVDMVVKVEIVMMGGETPYPGTQ